MSTGQRGRDQTLEVTRQLGALAEVTGCLPRQLRQLSAELQACLGGDDGLDSSITAARFALSEAATAALALDRRLADAAGHLATVMAEKD